MCVWWTILFSNYFDTDSTLYFHDNNSDRIIHHVGQGMHGNVASAIDTRDNSIVAIKISRGSPDERQGAEFEVQMLKELLKKAGDAV